MTAHRPVDLGLMSKPRRIYAWDLGYQLRLGPTPPLVVCAHDEAEKGAALKIEGSISLREFESRLPSIPTDREIVFFCSSLQDATAARRAAEYQGKGYTRVEILRGGMDAWNSISGFL